jgi:hypothetical protein
VKVTPYGFGSFAWHYGGQRFGGGLLHVAQAAEVGQKALPSLLAYTGNIQ